jgi:hypothetical protein
MKKEEKYERKENRKDRGKFKLRIKYGTRTGVQVLQTRYVRKK